MYWADQVLFSLQLPHPQVLVIDRLHAGARHHVVIDFGCVVQLTDILIPQCTDIMSLSIDVWSQWDDPDVQRIAAVSDINLCACVLKDILPPPLCRYVKVSRLLLFSLKGIKIRTFEARAFLKNDISCAK